jgi:predicted  nucleic acid-binding Zn-ribbon protein
MQPDPNLRSGISFRDGELLSRLSEIHARLLRHKEKPLRLVRPDQPLGLIVEETSEILKQLERDALAIRASLSEAARRIYDAFTRARRLPLVARVRAGLCGECNLRLPSAMGTFVNTSTTLWLCPHCSRVLLPDGN